MGFAAIVAHHTDIGGRFPGGMGTAARTCTRKAYASPASSCCRVANVTTHWWRRWRQTCARRTTWWVIWRQGRLSAWR